MPEITWTPLTEGLPPVGRFVMVGWYTPHSRPAGKWACFEAVYLDGTDEDLMNDDTGERLKAGWYTESECSCYDSFYLNCAVAITHWAFKPAGPQGAQIDMPAEQPVST